MGGSIREPTTDVSWADFRRARRPRSTGASHENKGGGPSGLAASVNVGRVFVRYAASNENFVPVVGPHNGPGARSAPRDTGLTSQGLCGISGAEPLAG